MRLELKRSNYYTQSRVTYAANGETDKETQHLCRLLELVIPACCQM